MSKLAELLASGGRPVVTAEMPAVDSGGLKAVRRHLDRIGPYVDAVNATDNPAAHAHASNVAIAIALTQLGVEPILQVVCRDKNRLAIQADIVGAALFGIENICALTGDDVTAGDEPESRRVFDIDGPQLIEVATGISQGHFLSGRPIDPPPPLFVGAVENPGAPPLAHRVERAAKKGAVGARFLQLQICYHEERLADFVAGCVAGSVTDRTALLPTICLVKSSRALRFMDEKVPGIAVPADVIRRVEGALHQSEAAYQLALGQARHALSLPGVSGIHLADFRHDDSLARLVTDLGLQSVRQHEITSDELTKEQSAHGPQLAR